MTARELPPPHDPSTCYVVDLGDWIEPLVRSAAPVRIASGERVEVVRGFATRLRRFFEHRRPAFLVVVDSSRGWPGTRRAIWPGYRLKRTTPDAVIEQVDTIATVLQQHRIPMLRGLCLEAEDWIATSTRVALEAGLRVVVVTRSHAPWQLVDDAAGVMAWTGSFDDPPVDEAAVLARYGVGAGQLADVWALAGRGDEAPGIEGVGLKTACELVARHKNLADVLRKWQWNKPKLAARLRDGRDLARMSRELVTLNPRAPHDLTPWSMVVGWDDDRARRIRSTALHLGCEAMLDVEPLAPISITPAMRDRWLELEGGADAAAG